MIKITVTSHAGDTRVEFAETFLAATRRVIKIAFAIEKVYGKHGRVESNQDESGDIFYHLHCKDGRVLQIMSIVIEEADIDGDATDEEDEDVSQQSPSLSFA